MKNAKTFILIVSIFVLSRSGNPEDDEKAFKVTRQSDGSTLWVRHASEEDDDVPEGDEGDTYHLYQYHMEGQWHSFVEPGWAMNQRKLQILTFIFDYIWDFEDTAKGKNFNVEEFVSSLENDTFTKMFGFTGSRYAGQQDIVMKGQEGDMTLRYVRVGVSQDDTWEALSDATNRNNFKWQIKDDGGWKSLVHKAKYQIKSSLIETLVETSSDERGFDNTALLHLLITIRGNVYPLFGKFLPFIKTTPALSVDEYKEDDEEDGDEKMRSGWLIEKSDTVLQKLILWCEPEDDGFQNHLFFRECKDLEDGMPQWKFWGKGHQAKRPLNEDFWKLVPENENIKKHFNTLLEEMEEKQQKKVLVR